MTDALSLSLLPSSNVLHLLPQGWMEAGVGCTMQLCQHMGCSIAQHTLPTIARSLSAETYIYMSFNALAGTSRGLKQAVLELTPREGRIYLNVLVNTTCLCKPSLQSSWLPNPGQWKTTLLSSISRLRNNNQLVGWDRGRREGERESEEKEIMHGDEGTHASE